ncbi:hypothetical protein [Paraburkholderia phosphatilytica]|nr:hypothetical protein [Paraburkholderia phosphatilytica]
MMTSSCALRVVADPASGLAAWLRGRHGPEAPPRDRAVLSW